MSVLNKIRKFLEDADGDGLREMVRVLAEALMNAEVDGLCGAGHGERNPEGVNRRNGCRSRRWDTRVGTIDLQIPRTRKGSYLPEDPAALQKRALREGIPYKMLAASILHKFVSGQFRKIDG